MNQPQPVAAEQKKPVSAQMAETTYFVMISDDYEKKAAQAYLQAIYPGTAARVVQDLRLDRLTDRHTVIALYRPDDRTPAVQMRLTPQGLREPLHTPVADLMKEVREGKPVECKQFWQRGSGNEGELNLSGFLEELGKQCAPAVIKYIARDHIMRLGFA